MLLLYIFPTRSPCFFCLPITWIWFTIKWKQKKKNFIKTQFSYVDMLWHSITLQYVLYTVPHFFFFSLYSIIYWDVFFFFHSTFISLSPVSVIFHRLCHANQCVHFIRNYLVFDCVWIKFMFRSMCACFYRRHRDLKFEDKFDAMKSVQNIALIKLSNIMVLPIFMVMGMSFWSLNQWWEWHTLFIDYLFVFFFFSHWSFGSKQYIYMQMHACIYNIWHFWRTFTSIGYEYVGISNNIR